MSETQLLIEAINGLQQTNEQLLKKLVSNQKPPVFLTTDELKERWHCQYAVINSQMKKGLKPCKMSGKKMLFRLSVVEAWENETF